MVGRSEEAIRKHLGELEAELRVAEQDENDNWAAEIREAIGTVKTELDAVRSAHT